MESGTMDNMDGGIPTSMVRGVTDSVDNDILAEDDIRKILEKHRKDMLHHPLQQYLNQLLGQKRLSIADVIRDSGLTKSYVYQIFNGEKNPSRDKLIALAFGLHLTLAEANRLLMLGGCGKLYARLERDAVIAFAFRMGMDIWSADTLLDENGLPTLLEPDK